MSNQYFSNANRRKDMMPPCAKGCKARYPGCHDHCKDPDYLEWKRLNEARKKDERERAASIERDQIATAQRYRRKGHRPK